MKLKYYVTKAFSLLLVVIMMLGMSNVTYAKESSISFEDGKLISFAPGSTYVEDDLFDNFKGIMPGDTLSEKIIIQNKSNDFDYIKVYIRAIYHDEFNNPISDKVLNELHNDKRREEMSEIAYMYDFLSQLSMTVKNKTEIIFDATCDKLDGFIDNVYLGKLSKGESLNLDIELNVPITMGNEYANRIGELDWVFVVEGFDEPTPPPLDDTMLTVRKVWVDDGKDRPDSIMVELLQDGKGYDKVELNQSNNWAYTWDKLDKKYSWSVVEIDVPSGYEATYKTEGNITTITNTKKQDPTTPVEPQKPANPINLGVIKKWDDEGKNRPESQKVTLYNGDIAVESVWLGDWNNWTYSWKDLDGNGNWQIIETDIPKGYVPSYSYKDGVVTITNTATLIHTGQLNWPILVMGGVGFAFITYGIFVILKRRKNENA